MKKYFFLIAVSFLLNSCNNTNKTVKPDSINGKWKLENNNTIIEIFKKENNRYYGKIVEVNEQNALLNDINNPNEKLRDREIIGLELLNDFEFDKSNFKWENGKIYDPIGGKTYDCIMWFNKKSIDKLYIKGFITIEAVGREEIWDRVK